MGKSSQVDPVGIFQPSMILLCEMYFTQKGDFQNTLAKCSGKFQIFQCYLQLLITEQNAGRVISENKDRSIFPCMKNLCVFWRR